MLRTIKPKNARSKRALEAREPKEIEDPRTCLFIKGTKTGEVLNGVVKDLTALKRPYSISFNKKNELRPFEDSDPLSFFSQKNDATSLIFAQTTKKRPDNLVLARTFDGRVLDLLELGVESFIPMDDFKGTKSTPGHRPLLHFASDLFEAHPALAQLKSHMLSLFTTPGAEPIHLSGIEHVISVTIGPLTSGTAISEDTPTTSLPKVHVRVYTIAFKRSGVRTPNAVLAPMGPAIDIRVRRIQAPDPVLLKESLKRPKLAKKDVTSGLGKKKKNLEVDEMGDLRGQLHVSKPDLNKMQTRKMKGLKKGRGVDDEGDVEMDGEDEGEETDGGRKKRRTE